MAVSQFSCVIAYAIEIMSSFFFDRIRVTNSSLKELWGTVRIFLCSVNNEAKQPYFLEGTRKNAIEMDRFVLKCKWQQKFTALAIVFSN